MKHLSTGPELPYGLDGSAMATTPDGNGVILVGGNLESGNLDSILELRADGKGSVGSWLTLSAYLQFAQRSHLLKITFCYSHLLKIWSVHICNRGMKPSHLAGSFEYLYMFWPRRH